MIVIILVIFLILPFILVALGMSMWTAIISWIFFIVVALVANVWFYIVTEGGREKILERTREAAGARRRRNESVLARDSQGGGREYGPCSDSPSADETSTDGFYDDWSEYDAEDGFDCGDAYSSDCDSGDGYGSDCGDGNGMC